MPNVPTYLFNWLFVDIVLSLEILIKLVHLAPFHHFSSLWIVLRSVLYSSGVAQEYWTITSSTAQILSFRPVPSGLLLLVPSPSVPCVPPVVVPTSVGADVLLAVPGEQLIIIICVLLLLLAPTGALIAIPTYYWSSTHFFRFSMSAII